MSPSWDLGKHSSARHAHAYTRNAPLSTQNACRYKGEQDTNGQGLKQRKRDIQHRVFVHLFKFRHLLVCNAIYA